MFDYAVLTDLCTTGTVLLPTCIMEAGVGGELRAAMGISDRVIIDVTELGNLTLTTAAAATSNNFTALQVAGRLLSLV